LEGLVVRPLSAKLLPPSTPEKMGWVSRERMLDIAGRSRKPQIALAKDLGIKDYPCAAGGCLLTEPEYARKIKDLIEHDKLDMVNINLLRIGRHFRLYAGAKLIVGRNENENEILFTLAKNGDYVFGPATINGPIAVGKGLITPEYAEIACRIVARYCDRNGEIEADISYKRLPDTEERIIKIKTPSWSEAQLAELRV